MSDPSKNFGEAAVRYQTFRPTYPGEVFDFLFTHLKSGRSEVVDLGAGSGQATRTLSQHFDRVVAIEPDERLVAEAQLPGNARMEIKAAEAADFEDASVDAVISATAFHWMDQLRVCRNAARWLKSGGVFFPFTFDAFQMEGEAGEFYHQEFEKWKGHRDPRLVDRIDYEPALRNSAAFEAVIPFSLKQQHSLPSEEAAGLISTFSFARDYARATGDADGYIETIKEALLKAGETVTFVVPLIGALGVKG